MSNQSLNIMSHPVEIVGSSVGIPGLLTGLARNKQNQFLDWPFQHTGGLDSLA